MNDEFKQDGVRQEEELQTVVQAGIAHINVKSRADQKGLGSSNMQSVHGAFIGSDRELLARSRQARLMAIEVVAMLATLQSGNER